MSVALPSLLEAAVRRQDLPALRRAYADQDEFVVVEDFLPREVVDQWVRELEALKPHIHRNFIPRHKKGGSVAFDTVDRLAPTMSGVYRSPVFQQFLADVASAPMKECPPSDQHRCAMYAYTEEGDHIGWHYDTSYYKDRRWTVLVGLVDRSSSKLLCDLHTKGGNGRAVEKRAHAVAPGSLVIFNGDKVWHCVTPTQAGEERFIVSMQYVTSGDMNPFLRFVSNMKDAIAYFGFKGVFFGAHKPAAAARS
jgi:hypothetical protein